MDSAATARISTPTKIDGRRLGEGAFFLLMLSGGAAGLLASVNGGLGADCVWMSGFGIFITHLGTSTRGKHRASYRERRTHRWTNGSGVKPVAYLLPRDALIMKLLSGVGTCSADRRQDRDVPG
jgi:hypothetical protein